MNRARLPPCRFEPGGGRHGGGLRTDGVATFMVAGFQSQSGRCADVKKAYVTLEEGNTIDVITGL